MKRLLMLVIGFFLIPVTSVAYTVPSGYSEIRSAPGVHLYQKGADYVQVVEIDSGARVQLHSGSLGSGVRGFEPISRYSLEDDWSQFSASTTTAFSTTNGAFFSANDCDVYTSVGIAFSLKIEDFMVAYGYGNNNEYVGEKMVWEIWGESTAITPFDDDWHTLESSSADNGVVGLNEFANKNPAAFIDRTFVGCADPNGNGKYKTVLILTSTSSSQSHAASELRSFGAAQLMMLDGGGSTQMICQGAPQISSCRAIPQNIRVQSITPFHCSLISPTVVNVSGRPNDILDIYVDYRNDGSEPWNNSEDITDPNSVELVSCTSNGLAIVDSWFIPVDWIGCPDQCNWQRVTGANVTPVAQGQTARFSFHARIPPNAPTGDTPVYFRLTHGGQLMNDWGGFHFLVHVDASPVGSNLSFETDTDPADGIPDGWSLHTPSGFTYGSGGAPDGVRYVRFSTNSNGDERAMGTNAAELINPNTWYRLSFWYRTMDSDLFKWVLSKTTLTTDAITLGAVIESPIIDNTWHRYWSAPFQVTAEELATYPKLTFRYGPNVIGAVDIDWVSIEQHDPCQ